MASTTKKKPPIMWSSLTTHAIKISLHTVFVIHAVISAHRSNTAFSYVANALILLLALWMVKGEVDVFIKRLRRQLPPGFLGFPIHREIKLITDYCLNDKRRRYGTFYTQFFFGQAIVVCDGQDDLTWLFNNDRKALTEVLWRPPMAALQGPWAVTNQTGSYHRMLRRLLEPYFAPKFVNNYLTMMDETTKEELETWSATGDFVSSNVFKMYSLRLFFKSAFGRTNEEVLAILHDDFKLWLDGALSLTTLRIPGMRFDKAMKARGRILAIVGQLIDEFIVDNPEESERAKTTIIGRMIYGKTKDNNSMLTRDEIKDNVLILIFAGHDTTYASISTLLYHLSQNPDAMEALVEEVTMLSEPLQADDLKNAPVLNACIHESWRMDPPVHGRFRKAVKGIEHKGYSIPADTVFFYSIRMATTDESIYINPYTFDMRRFLPKDHHLYIASMDCGVDPFQGRANYPVFGGGTHMCLGKSFALLELRVLAVRMAKNYKVEVRNPKKTVLPITAWNIEFKMTKRKND